jgi:putative transcriptional regulator
MEVEVRVKINELLEEHNISLRELSRKSDISHSKLSLLSQQKRQKIQISHIKKICEALNITDPSKIIEIYKKEEEYTSSARRKTIKTTPSRQKHKTICLSFVGT